MIRSRFLPTLAALVLTAGCGGVPTANQAAAAPTPAATRSAANDYEACRDRADGDAPALIKCADDAIAAAGAKVDGAAAQADFTAALQAIGDQLGGDGQAGQVTFADRAVTLARARAAMLGGGTLADASGTPPILTGEAKAAWAKSRVSSCAEHPIARCAARYDALLTLLPGGAPMTAAEGLPLPTCAEIKAADTPTGDLVDAFDARYPKALKGEESVETVALDGAALDNVVGYVTCIAGLTSFDVTVADDSLALFASKRHGAAALARLDALAAGGGEQAPAAKSFRKQIGDYLKGPGA